MPRSASSIRHDGMFAKMVNDLIRKFFRTAAGSVTGVGRDTTRRGTGTTARWPVRPIPVASGIGPPVPSGGPNARRRVREHSARAPAVVGRGCCYVFRTITRRSNRSMHRSRQRGTGSRTMCRTAASVAVSASCGRPRGEGAGGVDTSTPPFGPLGSGSLGRASVVGTGSGVSVPVFGISLSHQYSGLKAVSQHSLQRLRNTHAQEIYIESLVSDQHWWLAYSRTGHFTYIGRAPVACQRSMDVAVFSLSRPLN